MSDIMRNRVSSGVTWLDENRPGWLERIDLDALDLSSPFRCILGQEWLGEYPGCDKPSAFLAARKEWNAWNGDPDWAPEMGFSVCYGYQRSYPELTAIWKDEITRLREERAR